MGNSYCGFYRDGSDENTYSSQSRSTEYRYGTRRENNIGPFVNTNCDELLRRQSLPSIPIRSLESQLRISQFQDPCTSLDDIRNDITVRNPCGSVQTTMDPNMNQISQGPGKKPCCTDDIAYNYGHYVTRPMWFSGYSPFSRGGSELSSYDPCGSIKDNNPFSGSSFSGNDPCGSSTLGGQNPFINYNPQPQIQENISGPNPFTNPGQLPVNMKGSTTEPNPDRIIRNKLEVPPSQATRGRGKHTTSYIDIKIEKEVGPGKTIEVTPKNPAVHYPTIQAFTQTDDLGNYLIPSGDKYTTKPSEPGTQKEKPSLVDSGQQTTDEEPVPLKLINGRPTGKRESAPTLVEPTGLPHNIDDQKMDKNLIPHRSPEKNFPLNTGPAVSNVEPGTRPSASFKDITVEGEIEGPRTKSVEIVKPMIQEHQPNVQGMTQTDGNPSESTIPAISKDHENQEPGPGKPNKKRPSRKNSKNIGKNGEMQPDDKGLIPPTPKEIQQEPPGRPDEGKSVRKKPSKKAVKKPSATIQPVNENPILETGPGIPPQQGPELNVPLNAKLTSAGSVPGTSLSNEPDIPGKKLVKKKRPSTQISGEPGRDAAGMTVPVHESGQPGIFEQPKAGIPVTPIPIEPPVQIPPRRNSVKGPGAIVEKQNAGSEPLPPLHLSAKEPDNIKVRGNGTPIVGHGNKNPETVGVVPTKKGGTPHLNKNPQMPTTGGGLTDFIQDGPNSSNIPEENPTFEPEEFTGFVSGGPSGNDESGQNSPSNYDHLGTKPMGVVNPILSPVHRSPGQGLPEAPGKAYQPTQFGSAVEQLKPDRVRGTLSGPENQMKPPTSKPGQKAGPNKIVGKPANIKEPSSPEVLERKPQITTQPQHVKPIIEREGENPRISVPTLGFEPQNLHKYGHPVVNQNPPKMSSHGGPGNYPSISSETHDLPKVNPTGFVYPFHERVPSVEISTQTDGLKGYLPTTPQQTPVNLKTRKTKTPKNPQQNVPTNIGDNGQVQWNKREVIPPSSMQQKKPISPGVPEGPELVRNSLHGNLTGMGPGTNTNKSKPGQVRKNDGHRDSGPENHPGNSQKPGRTRARNKFTPNKAPNSGLRTEPSFGDLCIPNRSSSPATKNQQRKQSIPSRRPSSTGRENSSLTQLIVDFCNGLHPFQDNLRINPRISFPRRARSVSTAPYGVSTKSPPQLERERTFAVDRPLTSLQRLLKCPVDTNVRISHQPQNRRDGYYTHFVAPRKSVEKPGNCVPDSNIRKTLSTPTQSGRSGSAGAKSRLPNLNFPNQRNLKANQTPNRYVPKTVNNGKSDSGPTLRKPCRQQPVTSGTGKSSHTSGSSGNSEHFNPSTCKSQKTPSNAKFTARNTDEWDQNKCLAYIANYFRNNIEKEKRAPSKSGNTYMPNFTGQKCVESKPQKFPAPSAFVSFGTRTTGQQLGSFTKTNKSRCPSPSPYLKPQENVRQINDRKINIKTTRTNDPLETETKGEWQRQRRMEYDEYVKGLQAVQRELQNAYYCKRHFTHVDQGHQERQSQRNPLDNLNAQPSKSSLKKPSDSFISNERGLKKRTRCVKFCPEKEPHNEEFNKAWYTNWVNSELEQVGKSRRVNSDSGTLNYRNEPSASTSCHIPNRPDFNLRIPGRIPDSFHRLKSEFDSYLEGFADAIRAAHEQELANLSYRPPTLSASARPYRSDTIVERRNAACESIPCRSEGICMPQSQTYTPQSPQSDQSICSSLSSSTGSCDLGPCSSQRPTTCDPCSPCTVYSVDQLNSNTFGSNGMEGKNTSHSKDKLTDTSYVDYLERSGILAIARPNNKTRFVYVPTSPTNSAVNPEELDPPPDPDEMYQLLAGNALSFDENQELDSSYPTTEYEQVLSDSDSLRPRTSEDSMIESEQMEEDDKSADEGLKCWAELEYEADTEDMLSEQIMVNQTADEHVIRKDKTPGPDLGLTLAPQDEYEANDYEMDMEADMDGLLEECVEIVNQENNPLFFDAAELPIVQQPINSAPVITPLEQVQSWIKNNASPTDHLISHYDLNSLDQTIRQGNSLKNNPGIQMAPSLRPCTSESLPRIIVKFNEDPPILVSALRKPQDDENESETSMARRTRSGERNVRFAPILQTRTFDEEDFLENLETSSESEFNATESPSDIIKFSKNDEDPSSAPPPTTSITNFKQENVGGYYAAMFRSSYCNLYNGEIVSSLVEPTLDRLSSSDTAISSESRVSFHQSQANINPNLSLDSVLDKMKTERKDDDKRVQVFISDENDDVVTTPGLNN